MIFEIEHRAGSSQNKVCKSLSLKIVTKIRGKIGMWNTKQDETFIFGIAE